MTEIQHAKNQPGPAQHRLLVFARVPLLGRVKSRLAATIGNEAALATYRELLAITRAAVAASGVPATVWLADSAGAAPTAAEAGEWPGLAVRCQPAGDLGQRMAAAFAHAFAEGAGRVVIIGTDCPGLRAAHLTQAFASLVENDLVLGPATDGGYYLLGLRAPRPTLFEDKPWSTATVLAETVAEARQLGLRVALLPELRDVDDATDLAEWRAQAHAAPAQ